ncbi:MAG: AAA family ATPase, partial [Fusobacterium sp.]|nr:AAA family ATPase [Fusobacterium sp.]
KKEMGIGQAIQAEAAGISPEAIMNPILLKTTNEKKIKVFINGEEKYFMFGNEYHEFKKELIPILEKAYKTLENKSDIMVIEGAGSPAEINMKHEDISNMGMAKLVDAPVILVADIDRGGVFASIYGTIMLLNEEDRKRIKAIVINKFRGEKEVLKSGFDIIEKLTGVPTIGILPYDYVDLEDEDSISERDKNTNLISENLKNREYREEQFKKLEKIVRENIDIKKIYEIMGV